MKRFVKLFVLSVTCVLTTTLVGGCGIQTATEDTRDLVRNSNVTQTAILDGINKTLDATNQMRGSVHLQILTLALQNMTAAENTVFLNPPTLMMPYAEAFAAEATPDELAKASYVLLNTALLPAQGEETAQQKQTRIVSYAAFITLAGLTAKPKFDELLSTQIDKGGRYIDVAGAMAAARYGFLRDVLFNPLVQRSQTLTKGSLAEAVDRFDAMKALVTLPYAAKLGFTSPLKTKVSIDSIDKLRNLGADTIDAFKAGLPADTYAQNQALLNQFVIP